MKGELDPYAPPRADPLPAAATLPVDSGSLWRVVDGRLQFRDGAVLPDIGPDGSPNGEPGPPFSLVLETKSLPALVRGLGLLLLGIIFAARMFPSGGVWTSWFFAFFLAVAWLPRWLGPKIRLQVFRSKPKEQAALYRGLLWVFAVAILQFSAQMRWPGIRPEEFWAYMGMTFASYQFVLLATGKAPPAREVEDGWFEWKGLKPEAIPHLEEIQQRHPPIGPH